MTKMTVLLALVGELIGRAATPAPRLPYTFEQNQGQSPAAVKFQARGEGYRLYLTEREAVLSLPVDATTQQVIRMSLDGSNAPASIQGVDAAGAANYFVGDRSQWKTNVPTYRGVRYAGVYNGIDLVYHNGASHLEYDFVVAPHTTSDAIRVRFAGVPSMRITQSGALEMSLGNRKLVHQAPVAYQEINGRRRNVAVAYTLTGDRVGFRVGAHDENRELVIDPVVLYSTFLGGDKTDVVNAVAVDADNNVYVTGETTSTNFPVVGAGITKAEFALVYGFVTKINAAGSALVYSAYIGGGSSTRVHAVSVDAQGNAFFAGVTGARDFPLVNPVQSTQPGLNIGFVTKLNPQGNALLFSTYIGGERNDDIRGLALDSKGNIHIAGITNSTQFPTTNALQGTIGGSSDAFVAMYTAPAYRLAYSTFLGTAAAEEGNAIAVDAAGNTYVTGIAASSGLATAGAYQAKVASANDSFVAKINAAGTQLEWFTYYGGNGDDQAHAIALDASGSVLIGGSTSSSSLPITSNAIQKTLGGFSDAFLAKLSADGKSLLYGTYLGSSAKLATIETINSLAVDSQGYVTVSGLANGSDFPFVRQIQNYGGGTSDGFVARLNPTLGGLVFSTPLGGTLDDSVLGMAVDNAGGVHVGGQTLSTNFPLKNAVRSNFGGSQEGFVAHICDPYIVTNPTVVQFTYELGKTVPAAQNVQISACAPIPYSSQAKNQFINVSSGVGTTNGTISVAVDPKNLDLGTYEGSIEVTAPDAANNPQQVKVVLNVVGPPPAISAAGIVSAATAVGGAISPGELVVMYGANLGPQSIAGAQLTANGTVATSVAGTTVYFDGVPAPIVYTYTGLVSVVVPYSVAGKATSNVQVDYKGVRSNIVSMAVTQTAPGLFTANASGKGAGAILNENYSLNRSDNAAVAGSLIFIYGTGEGQTNPGGSDGMVAGASLPKPLAPVTVTIGGVEAELTYAGAAPYSVSGVFQINARIPQGLTPGNAEIRVKIGGVTSPAGVTVAVK